jgi:hypothetical protein
VSLRVIHAAGSWRDIGRTYGEEFREEIQRAVSQYATVRFAGETAPLHERLRPFAAAARRHAPERYAELEGMADGAAMSLDDALLLNCIEELTAIEACTTAGKGRFLIHAEMWYAEQTDIAVLVATPIGAPTAVAVSCAGFLTGVGASAAGFAQGVQSTFADDDRVGVPRVMPSRDALFADGVQAALAAASAPHRAGGYGYVLASRGRHRTLETSATRAAVGNDAVVAVRTNHYLSSLKSSASPPSADSIARFDAAASAVARARLESLADCRALLGTDGFRPCGPSDTATIFGLACDLASGALCVSDGDPRDDRWTSLAVPHFTPVTRLC